MFATINSPEREPLPTPISEEARDAQLLAQVAFHSDCAAFETLHARHIDAVTSAALRICGNRSIAEEIAQQTFWTLWERADRVAAKSVQVRPWLKTVARNAAIDAVRSQSHTTVSFEDLAERLASDDETVRTMLARESSDELHRALCNLSPKQRDAVELIFFRNMSYREAATATGLPVATVKSRVRLAVTNLRRLMKCS